MEITKRIGLVAHDACKYELMNWLRKHANKVCKHTLVCTGTTGKLIQEMLAAEFPHLSPEIKLLKSGPLGGDQQMGAAIADNSIDILIFLTDPMTAQPHDVDVKALVRLCSVYNLPIACTLSTADYLVSSPMFDAPSDNAERDYSGYTGRSIS